MVSSGLEKMLANMLGVTPEALEGMVSNTIGLLTKVTEQLERIEAKVDYLAIHSGIDVSPPAMIENNATEIEGAENVNGN